MERATQGVDLIEAIGDYQRDMRMHVFPILRASADPRATNVDFRPEEFYAAS